MTTSDYDYDLFVIGAGSGGVRASRMAASFGAKVAIAEEYRVGGTCVIRGCVPKKLMTYAAHYHEDFEDAIGYGWDQVTPGFDWQRFIAAKDAEIDRLNGAYKNTLRSHNVEIFQSRAVLEDAHHIRMGDRVVSADTILIATGGAVNLPRTPGVELAITSNEAFHLKTLPKKIVIVGGGYIAVEFAGIFNGLGSDVTLIYRRERILRGFDEDIRKRLQQALIDKGINILCQTDVAAIRKADPKTSESRLLLSLDNGDELESDELMYAIGRRPNTEGLGLDRAGVQLDTNGAVRVDDYSRTNIDTIWAVGDVTDRIALTPVAIKEGHAFALTRFNKTPTAPDHHNVASAVFSHPPIGSVGMTEDQALDKLGDVDVYESDFRPMKHTLANRADRAYAKVIVDCKTDHVVGIHMIGPDAPEIIQGFAVAMKLGLTKSALDQTVAIHPTSAEELVLMRNRRG
ncbi:glutathione-disulfide reductase [Iodidimonas nitroreducens]|uniref:Glutathione reductase n=1 Tax=Iodidimonas nitroreducens TaxID=1236968 RepID=A0A5A7NAC7_9PROT|nr:glutathione-disulfide reductase [Iodidimonas nitroreducens]GAK32266.1 glutathione reductase, chloroplastic [alpha proteobacterium Q-1]GER04877.1 glutathione-disulfide reductase [Iodidimonas nitroreducens]